MATFNPVFIGGIHLLNFFLLPFPELPGVHALHPVKETGEGGDFGEMELLGDLGDAQRGLAQEEHGLHQQPTGVVLVASSRRRSSILHKGLSLRNLKEGFGSPFAFNLI